MWSQHEWVITCTVKYGIKSFIHSQTSIVAPLKFGNRLVIPSHTNGFNHLPVLGIKLIHVSKRGPDIPTPLLRHFNSLKVKALLQYPIRRFIVAYHKVSKQRSSNGLQWLVSNKSHWDKNPDYDREGDTTNSSLMEMVLSRISIPVPNHFDKFVHHDSSLSWRVIFFFHFLWNSFEVIATNWCRILPLYQETWWHVPIH